MRHAKTCSHSDFIESAPDNDGVKTCWEQNHNDTIKKKNSKQCLEESFHPMITLKLDMVSSLKVFSYTM